MVRIINMQCTEWKILSTTESWGFETAKEKNIDRDTKKWKKISSKQNNGFKLDES